MEKNFISMIKEILMEKEKLLVMRNFSNFGWNEMSQSILTQTDMFHYITFSNMDSIVFCFFIAALHPEFICFPTLFLLFPQFCYTI